MSGTTHRQAHAGEWAPWGIFSAQVAETVPMPPFLCIKSPGTVSTPSCPRASRSPGPTTLQCMRLSDSCARTGVAAGTQLLKLTSIQSTQPEIPCLASRQPRTSECQKILRLSAPERPWTCLAHMACAHRCWGTGRMQGRKRLYVWHNPQGPSTQMPRIRPDTHTRRGNAGCSAMALSSSAAAHHVQHAV